MGERLPRLKWSVYLLEGPIRLSLLQRRRLVIFASNLKIRNSRHLLFASRVLLFVPSPSCLRYIRGLKGREEGKGVRYCLLCLDYPLPQSINFGFMDSYHDLPFKIGQLAESKSFIKGYRGAWFRCQIKDFAVRQRHMSYAMEYYDFPDEEVGWMKLYEKPHMAKGRLQQEKLQLMVRPCFPRSYLENAAPNLDNVSEVVVVYRDTWKVGDHVDWWCEGCYWSAQITDLIGSDRVQIALLEPPLGEGGSYEALCKDLRPSLEWSLEDGWTVPKALEKNETTAPCARFIIPFNKESKDASHDALGNQGTGKLEEDENKKQSCAMNMTVSLNSSVKMQPLHQMPQDKILKVDPLEQASYTKENVEEKLQGKEGAHVRCKDGGIGRDVVIPTAGLKMEIVDHNKLILPKKRVRKGNSEIAQDHKAGKSSVVIGCPTLHEEGREANAPKKGSCKIDNSDFKGFSNRSTIRRKEELNLTIYPDTVESSILAIEELINKIKWVNGVLQFGIERASSKKASWQFLDNNNLSLE